MNKLLKSILLALALTASGAVLADPPPANPNPGDTYIGIHTECFASVCFNDRFYYRWTVINGVGMWSLYYFVMETRDRHPQQQ
jgi:hypothetical protein